MHRETSRATVTTIGGEMVAWSDWDGSRGPDLARGLALQHVIADLVSGDSTVLVAGPHHDELVMDLLNRGASITWLVRSIVDAERISAQLESVNVLCGSVSKLGADTQYDLVIATDGLDRLTSAEGDTHRAFDALPALAAVVRPGGVLVQIHDNPLGIHHAVELAPDGVLQVDSAWYRASDYDRWRPMSLVHVEKQLADQGLRMEASYSVYPTPRSPSVLIPDSMPTVGESAVMGHLGAALSLAYSRAYRGVPVLSDPRRLVHRALAAGAETILAPGWLTVARAGSRTASHSRSLNRSGILLGDDLNGSLYELSTVGSQPLLEQRQAAPSRPSRAGLRFVGGASDQPSAGVVFEERLSYLCARADLTGLRHELRRYVEWLSGHAKGGMIAGPVALASPDVVLVDGERFEMALPAWEPVKAIEETVVVLRSLWVYALRLVTGTLPHPWDFTSTADDLAVTLMAMLDRSIDVAKMRAAKDLQVAYETAAYGLTQTQQRTRRTELERVRAGSTKADIAGFRELSEALTRQRLHIEHLEALRTWTEEIIQSRDAAHSRMDFELQLYRQTAFGRFLGILRAVARAVRHDFRKAVRKVISSPRGRQTQR